MLTSASETQEKFCRTYNLAKTNPSARKPFAHQLEALGELNKWFRVHQNGAAGGILALPTGGGKTYTAWRFLCRNALSQGYKVLWLAHTHHLLEQAFYSLESEVGEIDKARQKLKVRVVSGTIGHFRAAHIQTSDDVVICTLQSITHAYQEKVKPLEAFLKSAGDRLFVVFDEAHHSPAPSYCRFINALRDRIPKMCLLGLTATPTYSDQDRAGWLKQLFPQGILYQVSPDKLLADNILAKPHFETASTAIEPDFDPQEYEKWVRDYRDLPESIITALASNQKRNDIIASTYVKHKEKYKKTIIFADRWFQCEYIKEALTRRDKTIRVDVVFSRVDANSGNADAKNQRTEDDNKKAIKKFRKNELDVLINVRMLTEGTDIPDVDTVFLTRQTTSKILLTQMVGRALRGSAAGGTDRAYIVSFVDNWQHMIDWAEYELGGGTIDLPANPSKNPPIHLISIDLVRQLAEQMDSGINVNTASFLSTLPTGWYQVKIDTQAGGRDDSEGIQRLIMVFEHEESGYVEFIKHVKKDAEGLKPFAEVNVSFDNVSEQLEKLQERFFFNQKHIGRNLLTQLFYISRHIAQDHGQAPVWFEFEQRDEHDLDKIALALLDRPISRVQEHEYLKAQYERGDRYWQPLYPSFSHFWSQYTACVAWILNGGKNQPGSSNGGSGTGETPPLSEVSEEVKRRVKQRDGDRCLRCGTTESLEIDHIKSRFHGGGHEEGNLQTLCKTCNGWKGTKEIDFRVHRTQLNSSNKTFPIPEFPQSNQPDSTEYWEKFFSQNINTFYHCQAVKSIDIPIDRLGYIWQINLNAGNNPRSLVPHLQTLMPRVQELVLYHDEVLKVPQKFVINAPGYDVICKLI